MIIKKYENFILNPNPSTLWKITRFVLHWVTLPLKIVLIGGLGISQIILKLNKKTRPIPAYPTQQVRKTFFRHVFQNLPVIKDDELELYVNRVPLTQFPNYVNHNTSHQCSRQGTYAFLMGKLGLRNEQIDEALRKHMRYGQLCRGYHLNPWELEWVYNRDTVSGDMLCGMNLAMLDTSYGPLKREYKNLIETIVRNDYAILHTTGFKSNRGMWQPGIETVGAQALTILASLRIASEVTNSSIARKEYNNLLWRYGYGLLSLTPTAYIDSQRGYFNDHNCLISLYALFRLADSPFGKLFWALPMVYVWTLSRHWYNGYFTGLVRECIPWLIPNSYVRKCQALLNEELPRTWVAEQPNYDSGEHPVKFNELAEDEFAPDVKQSIKFKPFDVINKNRGGLGYIAHAIMLEDNPKDLL